MEITSGKDVENLELSYIAGKKSKMLPSLWKTVSQFFKILKIKLPYDPTISPLVIYTREFKTYIYIKLVHECS